MKSLPPRSLLALALGLALTLPGLAPAQTPPPPTPVTGSSANNNPTPAPCCNCLKLLVNKQEDKPGQTPFLPPRGRNGSLTLPISVVHNAGTDCPATISGTITCVPMAPGKPLKMYYRKEKSFTVTSGTAATSETNFTFTAADHRVSDTWLLTISCQSGSDCGQPRILFLGGGTGNCGSCSSPCPKTSKPKVSQPFNVEMPPYNANGYVSPGNYCYTDDNFTTPDPVPDDPTATGGPGPISCPGPDTSVTTGSNGQVTSFHTGNSSLEVSPPESNGFTVTHKHGDGASYRVTSLTKVTDGGIPRRRVDTTFEGTTTRYEQIQPAADTLIMEEGKMDSVNFQPLRQETLKRVEPLPGKRIHRTTVKERASVGDDWTTVSVIETTWEKQIHGWVKTQEVLDPDGAAHTSTWTYYQPGEHTGEGASTAGLGRLKHYIGHDGSQAYYTYGLNTATVATTYAGNPLGRVTTTAWSPDSLSETVTITINGQIVAKAVTTDTETSLTRAVYTGSGQPLVTTTHYTLTGEPDFGGKPVKTIHPDGTLTTRQYTRHPGGGYTTVTETGATTNGNTVSKGTRTTTKANAQGETIESSTQDIESGVIVSQSLATTIDTFGRPTHVVHDNVPADYETFTYSCCGLQSHRARDGTTTSYVKDGLDRPVAETTTTGARVVTRTYDYSPEGLLPATTVTTTAPGVTGYVVQKTVRDALGRTLSSTSPGPMGTPETTTYTYSANGLITTQTNPDLGTIVNESYPDGQTKSITGTATIHQSYTYTTHNENGGGEVTTVTTANGLGGQSSSYTDLGGRTYKQTRTAPHGQTAVTTTTYNALGQAETITSSGQPSVKYLYNDEGEQIATWTDRNGDGQFNDTAVVGVKDSCTTTQSDYIPAASAPAPLGDSQRTITTVRTEADEDKILSTSWQSVDGLRSRQETLGVANPAIASRTRPLDGASTAEQISPDGTKVETAANILANGNTQTTSTRKDANGAVIESATSISDAMGRPVQTTNGRGHVTQYAYHLHTPQLPEQGLATIGQTSSVTQINANPEGGNLVTSYSYSLSQGSGRSVTTTLPDTSKQYQETNLLGQTTRQWGSQTNPVTFTYDSAGRMASHTTFRTPVGTGAQQTIPSAGDITRWEYDPSGVLLRKIYADNNKTTYTYDIAGRLATRAWARGVVTVYSYTAGQLTGVEYFGSVAGWENYRNLRFLWQSMAADPANHTAQEISDTEAAMLVAKTAAIHGNTPAVAATYNRLGQLLTSNQSGAATAPDADYTYSYHPDTLRLANETVTIDPDGSGSLPSLTRTIDRSRDNLQRPTGFVLGNEHAVGYGYDVSGRLATISAQGLPNLPGKSHAFEYTYEPGSSLLDKVTGPVHELDSTYETHRNVLSEKKNTRTVGTPGDLSIIGYTVNEIGQRVQRNFRGEIRAEFYGGQAADPYATNWGYDALGQVTSEDKPAPLQQNEPDPDRGYTYDLIGNRLTFTADNVTTSYESNELNQYSEISVPSVQSMVPIHDQDGNMTTGLINGSTTGQFEYNGANQLIRTQATTISNPTRYAYDAFGRRFAKATYPNAGGQATAATLFICDGWNLIAEYKLDSGAWTQDRTYTWGIDLSGSMQGAGGVGGLISVTKHQAQGTAIFYPIYDGNGNIEAYLDSNGLPAAIYQYDAFGNVLVGAGTGSALDQARFANRFSTKYQDAETGLLYYGYRYYQAALGGWLNRDPIEEYGGLNLYGFVLNQGVNFSDAFGLDVDYFIDARQGFEIIETKDIRSLSSEPIKNVQLFRHNGKYTVTPEITDCPSCLLVYIHGYDQTEAQTKRYDGAISDGYKFNKCGECAIATFSWSGAFGKAGFNDSVKAADVSVPVLASFIKATKQKCPKTRIHLVSHSLGARVLLGALKNLGEKGFVNDVGLVAPAVDNEVLQPDEEFGSTPGYVDTMYGTYNSEDDAFAYYTFGQANVALGDGGFDDWSMAPKNVIFENYEEAWKAHEGDGGHGAILHDKYYDHFWKNIQRRGLFK